MLENHQEVRLIQEQLQDKERGLLFCLEDVKALKRRLFSMTSKHETATRRAKCRSGPKALKRLTRLNTLEA